MHERSELDDGVLNAGDSMLADRWQFSFPPMYRSLRRGELDTGYGSGASAGGEHESVRDRDPAVGKRQTHLDRIRNVQDGEDELSSVAGGEGDRECDEVRQAH